MNRIFFYIKKLLIAFVLFIISNFSSCDKEVSVSAPPEPVPQGFLYVNTIPEGSTIYVNDKNTGRVTPDSLPYMEGGTYKITLKRKYYRDTTFTTDIPVNDKKSIIIDYTANPLMYGRIYFQSNPPGAEILLNDSSTGAITPYTLTGLFPGSYKVSYQKENYRSPSVIAYAESNKLVSVSLILADTSIWVDYRTVNSGIPTDLINSIAIDGNGIKWLGTANAGLVRFDGETFITYNKNNSEIPSNTINYVAADRQNRIWVCTSQGIGIFNGSSWTVFNTSNSVLPVNFINVVSFDDDGVAWIGTTSKLVRFDGINWEVISLNVNDYEYLWVNDISFENDIIWMATNRYGTVSYDRNENFEVYNDSTVNGYLSNSVASVAVDQDRINWFSFNPATITYGDGKRSFLGGFGYMNGSSFNATQIGTNTFLTRKIFIDENNKKWIPTNEGLITIAGVGGYLTLTTNNSELTSNNVAQVTADEDGNIWIATIGGGLIKYKGNK